MLFQGLMRDDTLYETEEVTEAIRRLPSDLYDQRIFRITRALHLSGQKRVLPKEEWMTLEKVGTLQMLKWIDFPDTTKLIKPCKVHYYIVLT